MRDDPASLPIHHRFGNGDPLIGHVEFRRTARLTVSAAPFDGFSPSAVTDGSRQPSNRPEAPRQR